MERWGVLISENFESMDNDLPRCRVCNDVLTSENWYVSHQKSSNKICRDCSLKCSKRNQGKYREKNKDKDPYDGTLKVCCTCKEIMLRIFDRFNPNHSKPDGLESYCRECKSIQAIKCEAKKAHEPWNPPTPFTGKEARALKKKQDHRCFVCGERENGEKLQLDHGHVSGRVRGYACLSCNTKILSWLDLIWKEHVDKRDWVRNDPIFYQILWHPPAEYLYDPL